MLSLPLITPRDSYEFWPGSHPCDPPVSYRQSPTNPANHPLCRGARNISPFRLQTNPLSTLRAEENALQSRNASIAFFGNSWIVPTGCTETMLGMKENKTEREEASMAAQSILDAEWWIEDDSGLVEVDEVGEQRIERNLDDDIPNADVEAEWLIEEGEEGLEERGIDDEEAYLGWDLNDETPDAWEYRSEQEGESQRTHPEEDDENEESEIGWPRFVDPLRTSTPIDRRATSPPQLRIGHETVTQLHFSQRWSSGGIGSDY
ncbi:hypothetical protein N7494_005447 [Penicillium frequentans]|uniref:Uncharacterized protein n=1 Tax=Penicillium frequentans TaxID=3151616 RepID=A0AAD6CY44_9EURO|nr:hypothetical protein N7494_005447 [Penicillium glabrum]